MKFYWKSMSGKQSGDMNGETMQDAIYKAWLIDVKLYDADYRLIYNPHESDDFNNGLLYHYGYKIRTNGFYRMEVIDVKSNETYEYTKKEIKVLY